MLGIQTGMIIYFKQVKKKVQEKQSEVPFALRHKEMGCNCLSRRYKLWLAVVKTWSRRGIDDKWEREAERIVGERWKHFEQMGRDAEIKYEYKQEKMRERQWIRDKYLKSVSPRLFLVSSPPEDWYQQRGPLGVWQLYDRTGDVLCGYSGESATGGLSGENMEALSQSHLWQHL